MTNNKHVGFLVAGALLIASASVWAVDEHHPAAASQPSAATPAKTAPATANSADTEKRFEQARQQMKKMQAQMDKIHQTKDPKERQRLMAEHMQAMQ
ncbi:MAG: hypothetical protein IMZ73_00500, partial [Chloroflexi bacterium]|nr:hypothetical protein [Chloroflexota bacterium]